jgi:hypothetical protein
MSSPMLQAERRRRRTFNCDVRAHNLYEAEQYFEARWPLLAKEARERYGEHSVRTELRNRSRYSVAAMNEGEVADADSTSSAVIEAFY